MNQYKINSKILYGYTRLVVLRFKEKPEWLSGFVTLKKTD